MPLSDFRKKKLLFVFNTFFDVNQSGSIDKKDFDLAVQTICDSRGWAPGNEKTQQTKETLFKIWDGLRQRADSDQDGQISRDEWYLMWEEYANDPDNAPEWQQTYMNFVFDLEDSSGDGSIDESEFSVVCRSHGVDDSEAREAFKKLQVKRSALYVPDTWCNLLASMRTVQYQYLCIGESKRKFTHCSKTKGCRKTRSGLKNEDLKLEDAVEEYAMTSLGKLVFVDAHSRHSKAFPSEESSNIDFTESLSLAFENLIHMPYNMIENYANSVHTLDISHNKFSRNLHFLSEFDNLTSLNLDHNNIDACTIFPYMPKLQLLWLNHNKVDDLFPFIKNLYESFPNLRYLCLMGNKAAPSYLNGGSFYDYLQYRLVVISWFPRLVHLDDRIITSEQRMEATRLFRRPLLEQLTEHAPIPDCIKVFHNKLTSFFIKSALPIKLGISKNSNFVI